MNLLIKILEKNDGKSRQTLTDGIYFYYEYQALINLEIVAEEYKAAIKIYPIYKRIAQPDDLLDILIKLNDLEHKKNENVHAHNTLHEIDDLFFKDHYNRYSFENFLKLAASELRYSDRTDFSYKKEISYVHNNEAKRLYLRFYKEEKRIFNEILELFYKEDTSSEDKIQFSSAVRFYGERIPRIIRALIDFETMYGKKENSNQYYAELSNIYSQLMDVSIIIERLEPVKREDL